MESLRALTDLLISMYRERLSNISTFDALLGAQCASNRIETRSDPNSRCRRHNPMPYDAHLSWNLCALSLTFLLACIESDYQISARSMLSLLRSAPPTASKLVPTRILVVADTFRCRTAPSVMESLLALTDLLISMYRERLSKISTLDALLGAQCTSNRIETRSDPKSRCRRHNPMPYGAICHGIFARAH